MSHISWRLLESGSATRSTTTIGALIATYGTLEVGRFSKPPAGLPISVSELIETIRQLSQEEFARLAIWIDEYRADQWDRQIEADVRAGRLDEAALRADADFDAGRCTPL